MEELKERLTKLEETLSIFIAKWEGVASKSDENFMKIEDRLGKIENKLDVLTIETSTNFTEVGDQLGGIKAELVKIEGATRYEQHYEDQKRFNISS